MTKLREVRLIYQLKNSMICYVDVKENKIMIILIGVERATEKIWYLFILVTAKKGQRKILLIWYIISTKILNRKAHKIFF